MEDVLRVVAEWLPYVAFFLPLVVGLVAKASLPERGKVAIMLFFTAIAALVSQVDANADVLTVEMGITWIGTTLATIASYYGVWKPIGLGNIKPETGIGPSNSPAVDGDNV